MRGFYTYTYKASTLLRTGIRKEGRKLTIGNLGILVISKEDEGNKETGTLHRPGGQTAQGLLTGIYRRGISIPLDTTSYS